MFFVQKQTTPFHKQVAIQSWLSPALTPVPANVDYLTYKDTLERVSKLMRVCSLEALAIDLALEGFPSARPGDRVRFAEFAVQSLRLEVLRHMHGMPSFREFSKMVCASDLLSEFCGLRRMDGIRGASKSTLERRSKLFSEEQLRRLHQTITEVCGNADLSGMIGLDQAVDMSVCLIDSTCLEANIHYPVDWVLLKDVSLTLIKATKLIRGAGVRCRMPFGPKEFARRMNRLCIEMTHCRRKATGKKERKRVLREMKSLLRTIGEHAERHRDELLVVRERTRFSEREAIRIKEGIDQKLEQLPEVIKQAHERIIGGRQVSNSEKILSVYEPDVHVLVRGKAGKEVEFGNTLTISETRSGYITDWRLYQDTAPAESKQLQESLERQNKFDLDDAIKQVCSDRGFSSKEGSRALSKAGIYDATCPRNPNDLGERMKEESFRSLQQRRAQTEGRIGTIKNRWLGGRLRAKGYTHRALAVGLGVLSHNLWFLARKLAQQEQLAKAA